ncbi:MAG: MetQ/NlpA family ABC transporter substrate-binding protein [Janthinobacterium lividum]
MTFFSKLPRRTVLLGALSLALASTLASAKDPKDVVIGASSGPYADQIKLGIKPILEKQGYKVKIVEFNDYVQPNRALAEGSLDANLFQHVIYLNKFAADNKLPLVDLVKVPTAPMGLYSTKHKSLADVKEGATVALPNDPTNTARGLVILSNLGWIKMRADWDPIRASEKDIVENTRKIKLIMLEAAQLPRSLGDTDYSLVTGNFALASGMKITQALAVEKLTPNYQNVVAIRSADKDTAFVKDLDAAFHSREFLDVTNKHFAGFSKTDYQLAMEAKK